MTKKMTISRAKKILRVVPASKSFWLCTNEYLKSLNSLADALERVSDDVFRYHVDKYKNDFAAWVKDCIDDKDLAREISRIKTRYTLIRKLKENVDEAKSLVKRYKKAAKPAAVHKKASKKTAKAKHKPSKRLRSKPKSRQRTKARPKAKPKAKHAKAKHAKSIRSVKQKKQKKRVSRPRRKR